MHLPRSLQGRLLALILSLVCGVWIATAVLTWRDVSHELDELLDSHLAQAAALLVAQQAGEIEDDDHGINAPSLHRYAPKVAFQVFHEGRLALRSSNAPAEPMLTFNGRAEEGFQSVTMDGATWRVFATYGRERDTQVFVGEQVAPAGDGGVVVRAPGGSADARARPHAGAAPRSDPAADRGGWCAVRDDAHARCVERPVSAHCGPDGL